MVALDLCDGDVKFRKVKFAVAVQVHAFHQFGCFHRGQGVNIAAFEGRQEFLTVDFTGIIQIHAPEQLKHRLVGVGEVLDELNHHRRGGGGEFLDFVVVEGRINGNHS